MNWYKISEEQIRKWINSDKDCNCLPMDNYDECSEVIAEVRQQPLPEPSEEVEKLKQKLTESEESEHELEDLVLSAKHMKEKAEQELADAKAEISRLRELEVDKFDLSREQPPEPIVCSGCGAWFQGDETNNWSIVKKEKTHLRYEDGDPYICGHAIPLSEFKKGEAK